MARFRPAPSVRALLALLLLLAGLAPLAAQQAAAQPAAAQPAAAQPAPPQGDPPGRPFLRVDGGFHTQVVNRIATDRAGRIVASVSDDKTIRLWTVADGAPVATLRVPVGERAEGELYAVALSPDAGTLLAGGWTGRDWDRSFALYVFDVARQEMRGRLPGLAGPVNHVVYDTAGTRFALALGGRAGVRVHDAKTGRLLFADAEFADRVTWAAFDAEGRLAAASFDGTVRLYAPDGRRIAMRKVAPAKPYSLAFSLDGRMLAVGFADRPRVDLLDAATLQPKAELSARGTGALSAVAWTSDGSVIAAGTMRDAKGATVAKAWSGDGKRALGDVAVARDTVMQILPVGIDLIAASADPALVRLTVQGSAVWRRQGLGLDFRDVADRGFRVSQTGTVVEVGVRERGRTWRIDLDGRSVTQVEPSLAVAKPRTPALTGWRNGRQPKLAGRVLALEAEELARSHAWTPDGKLLVLGTDYWLRTYRADGREAGTVRIPAAAWGVGVSGDGRVAVAALGDGTLRWYGIAADGALAPRVALALAADGRRWAAWTPEGFFDHSDTGGKELVGHLLNRGKAQTPEWFSFSQVYRLFYAPDLVNHRLVSGDPAEAAARLAEIGDVRRILVGQAPPQVRLASICPTAPAAQPCQTLGGIDAEIELPPGTTAADLVFSVADQGGGVGPVDLFVDERNAGRSAVPGGAGAEQRVSMPLISGTSKVLLRAYAGNAETFSPSRVLAVTVPAVREVDARPGSSDPMAGGSGVAARKPRLFVLVAGIDRYRDPIPTLAYAATDARSFADAIREGRGDLWSELVMTELYDEDATAAKLADAFRKIAAAAQPDDTFLVYLSGHGVAIDRRYYFVTQNVTRIEAIPREAFPETALVKALASVKAKNGMVFLDTCYAGALTLDSASQLAHESGRYVLAAASSVEEALDSYDNKNGVFATAILRGLRGGASKAGEDTVDNFELGFFVTPLVKKLAAEKNHRQSARFKITADDAVQFPIVEVTR